MTKRRITMPTKVKLIITHGINDGKEYVFDRKEALILGRNPDSSIVLPEKTVSRYHCLLDINPPSIMVRDFGSLNGTYLNGEKIGQREADTSPKEGQEIEQDQFALNSGDTLGLGKDCEISVSVIIPQFCSMCLNELGEDNYEETSPGIYTCNTCLKQQKKEEQEKKQRKEAEKKKQAEDAAARKLAQRKAEELAKKEKAAKDREVRQRAERERKAAEKRAADLVAKQEADRQRRAEQARKREEARRKGAAKRSQANRSKCEICGKTLPGQAGKICSECLANPLRALDMLLRNAVKGEGDAAKIKGYRKIRSLGKGGMGEVWLVEEEKTGKQMALKLMLPKAAVHEQSRNLFLREAHVASQLKHKNVVTQYKSGYSNDTYFILMELCSSGSLDDYIRNSGGKLPLDYATNITLQVLDGLIYTHAAKIRAKLASGETKSVTGVVHRDFKPGNIFLTGNIKHPVAKVADFGLAKAFEIAGLSGHTNSGSAAGTLTFMPRQQILNFKYAHPDVDVWAAAASFYFMLTGTFPKEFTRGKAPAQCVLQNSAIPIRKRNPKVPAKLAKVIDAALIDKPHIGVSTATELKRMIEGAL